MNPKDILTKELLIVEFIENKLSHHRIAKKYNIKSSNSVDQALKRFNLKRQRNNDKFSFITKDWLYQKYIIEDLSALDIAKLCNSNRKATIFKKLKEFNIPIRKTTQTKKYKEWLKNAKTYGTLSARYVYGLKASAKKRKLDWDLDGPFLLKLMEKQNYKCAISNVSIKFADKVEKQYEQTASLDRINSNYGYIENNVQWVHKNVNTMKWNLDQGVFIKWCKIIANNQKD